MNSTTQHSPDPGSIEPPDTNENDGAGPTPDHGVAPEPAGTREPSRVRNTVFLSYSHADKDAEWYADVREYLQQLSVGDDLKLWDDTAIKPGDDWHASIDEQLREAKAAVFLVTPTFLSSKFISAEEVPKLLERQEIEGLVVHALIAKPCDWEQHAIGDFLHSRQLSHSPDRTLEEMDGPERRRGLNELVKQIRRDIGIYRQRNLHERRTENIIGLEKLLGVVVEKEIAGGDTSIVYRARKGQQEIAIKAMVSRPITDAGQDELQKEFEKCRALQSPVFTRMFDLEFNDGYCVTSTDWVPGQKLSRRLEASRRNAASRQRWQDRTTALVSKLAAGLAEAHASGLRFLNVHPDKIRLFGDQFEPRLYPIDFSIYVASSAHSHGVFSFPMHTLEYLAPEYVSKPAEREDPLAQEGQADEAEHRMNCLADQYALGMVALTMLEGQAPVQVKALADVSRLMQFQKDPRGYTGDGEAPLDQRPWCREMPGLARVIWRMLEPDPADRWQDMSEVHGQLRALLLTDFSAPAHGTEAKATYRAHLVGNDSFYARFYARLFATSPGIEAYFAGVDMKRQRLLLDAAIERVLNFRANQCEPTTLTTVARSHRDMGLTPEQFEAFGQAFIGTLAEEPAVGRTALDAWQAVIWPALEYLKRATASATGAETPAANAGDKNKTAKPKKPPAKKKVAKPKNTSARKKAAKPKKASARKKAAKPK